MEGDLQSNKNLKRSINSHCAVLINVIPKSLAGLMGEEMLLRTLWNKSTFRSFFFKNSCCQLLFWRLMMSKNVLVLLWN